MLTADQMRILPDFFNDIADPRSRSGRRHRLSMVLSIAAAATLCGMKGYKAMAGWAQDLGEKARARLGCRRVDGKYVVPSESIIRDVLIRVDPAVLDCALQKWNEAFAPIDSSIAVDGKTMCNAIDDKGHQTHIMSAVGHESAICYTQKVGTLPVEGKNEQKQTNEIGMFTQLLDAIDIKGKLITADALLTQRKLADYVVVERGADYHFTAKGNQATLQEDIALLFQGRKVPDFMEVTPPDHGRIETRRIWCSEALNEYLDFPMSLRSF